MSIRSFLAPASAAAAALVLLAACSSAPPSAASIARRIPGCHPQAVQGGSAYALQVVSCNLPRQSEAWIATFSTSGAEMSWMKANANGGSCIQGNHWAAQVSYGFMPMGQAWAKTARELGGRDVSIGSCD